MAKFDKNMKNAYLDEDEIYDDEYYDEDDPGYEEDSEEDYQDYEQLTDQEDGPSDDEYGEEILPDYIADTSGSEEVKTEQKARWYVAHTYSGHENKVKINIEKIVENRGMQDLIQSVVVPLEDVVEIKNGQRKVKSRKMFPGYVLIKMVHTSETWYLVRNTQGVTGFVGHGSDPIPLTDEEVQHMGIDNVSIEIDIEIGDTVKIISGLFNNYMGVVEEINLKKQTVKVKIKETSVEVEFEKIEKVS